MFLFCEIVFTSNFLYEKEFQKLRNKVENSFVNSNSKMAGIAESLANYHMYFGDANLVTVAEVEKLMAGDASGRVSR